jgi:hypothetical protein
MNPRTGSQESPPFLEVDRGKFAEIQRFTGRYGQVVKFADLREERFHGGFAVILSIFGS